MARKPIGRVTIVPGIGILLCAGIAAVLASPAVPAPLPTPSSPQAPALVLTATGEAQWNQAAPTHTQTLVLSIYVREQGSDSNSAVRAANDRIVRIQAALQKLGVPLSDMRLSSATVGPNSYAPAGSPNTISVTEHMEVTITSPDLRDAAFRTALNAGASSVNNQLPGVPGTAQIDDSRMALAIKEATEKAKRRAQIAAEMAGVTLGPIRNVDLRSPIAQTVGTTVTWTVYVTVTYNIYASRKS